MIQPQQLHKDNIVDDPILSMQYFVTQLIGRIETVTLVKVVKVYHNDGVEPVGVVDVQPLIHQLNNDGSTTEHGIIHKIPYFRLQGGSNAIILDPKVGDIGMCGFCSRDSSGVVATKKASSPMCLRQYDLSDGLYIGGMLNGTPTQYVQFSNGGITLKSPTKVTIEAPDIRLNGDTSIQGTLTVSGVIKSLSDVVAKAISLLTHKHGGVKGGESTTSTPK